MYKHEEKMLEFQHHQGYHKMAIITPDIIISINKNIPTIANHLHMEETHPKRKELQSQLYLKLLNY